MTRRFAGFSGGDADYANDRPPADATLVKRLRYAGAIILAKANLAEYAVDGARSSFSGTFCNPYDTEREPGMSSGSASSVAGLEYRRRESSVVAEPHQWSQQKPANVSGRATANFDVAPDGKHIAMLANSGGGKQQTPHHVIFLQNFFDEVRRKVKP